MRSSLDDSKHWDNLKRHLTIIPKRKIDDPINWEITQLYKYMIVVQEKYLSSTVQIPFDIKYIIDQHLEKKTGEVLDRAESINILREFCEKINGIYGAVCTPKMANERLYLVKLILWQELASKLVVEKYKFSKEVFDELLDEVYMKIVRGILTSGEVIGVLAATSIASILTQLTLNVFHLAGVGTKGQVVQNMKTFDKLLKVSNTPDPKSVFSTIYFPVGTKENYIRSMIKIFNVNMMVDFMSEKSIIRDFGFLEGDTIYKEDMKYLKIFIKHQKESIIGHVGKISIRVKFNRKELHSRKISIEDITVRLIELYGDEIFVVNLGEYVIRIYVFVGNTFERINEIYRNLDRIKITGIPSIGGVELNKIKTRTYDPVTREQRDGEEIVLYTDGVNLEEILKLDGIDHLRTISNEILEVRKEFGIEAGRRVLMENMLTIIRGGGTNINTHWIHLLTEFMCYEGDFISIDMHGMNNSSIIEPLQKIAFESMETNFVDAAARGRHDSMNGVSSNVLTCQEGPYGRGMFNLVMKD